MDGLTMLSKQSGYRKTFLPLTILAALTLGACASSPKIFVNEDPDADFSSYKTYGFEENLGTDDGADYQSINSSYFKDAVAKQMEMRGYTPSDDPDLTINFYVHKEEKIRTTSSPTMGGYYGYRGYGAYGGYETTVTQYTEGTVNVDLIAVESSSGKKQLVWEGIAVGKITDKVQENFQEVVDVVVEDIFERYPY